jgi:ribonuclease HI
MIKSGDSHCNNKHSITCLLGNLKMKHIIKSTKVTIAVYVNGVTVGTPAKGGWGAYAISTESTNHEYNGYEPDTTSNRMELTAVVNVIKSLAGNNHLNILSNSKYLIDGMNRWLDNWTRNGWKGSKGKSVLNKDLWEQLHSLNQQHSVSWNWIRMKDGGHGSKIAYELAHKAINPDR